MSNVRGMVSQVHITLERRVITYSDFWRTSDVLLNRAQEKPEGSYFFLLGSLVFSAFSLEAFLNHIGEHIFKCWEDLEPLPPRSKLTVICERLSISVDWGAMPWQIVPEIVGFRNKVAHGKNALLRLEKIVPKDDEYEEKMREFLFAVWQNYATEENAVCVRARLKDLFKLIHAQANIEGDLLFDYGPQTGDAKVVNKDAL